MPPCQGTENFAFGVEFRMLEVGEQVLEDSRQVLVVDFLQVAEVVHLLRHVVGDDEDVAPARLALFEQRLQLAEEASLSLMSSM
jgi:hypothetical protein